MEVLPKKSKMLEQIAGVERVQLKEFQLRSPFGKAGITPAHLRYLLTVKFKVFMQRLVPNGVAHAMARNLLLEAMVYEIGVNLRSIGSS